MASGMDDRTTRVLRHIVEDYIATAEPVGSRTISKKMGQSLSPATIRNIMADLEEAGFLAQPHTSAGRIPTGAGFRYTSITSCRGKPSPGARWTNCTALRAKGTARRTSWCGR